MGSFAVEAVGPVTEVAAPAAELVRERILNLKGEVEKLYVELAELLYQVVHSTMDGDPLWQAWGYDTFEDYAQYELGMKRAKAYYFMQIWKELHIKAGISKERLAEVDWCLPAGSPIVCNPRTKNVEKVEKGDRVLSADGSFTEVVANTVLRADHLNEIKVDYFDALRATDHHTFPVIKGGQQLFRSFYRHEGRDHRRARGLLPNYQIEPIRADEIKVGDMMLAPRLSVSGAGEFESMPPEFFEFAGWYVAEGYVDRGRLCIGVTDSAAIDRLTEIAKLVFPDYTARRVLEDRKGSGWKDMHILRLSKPGGTRWTGSLAQIPKKFKAWFGESVYVKTFPNEFFGLDATRIRSFLRGLHGGDGSGSDKAVMVVHSVSKELVDRVRLLLSKLGVPGGLHCTKRRLPEHDLWNLYVGCADAEEIFGSARLFKGGRRYHFYRRLKEGLAIVVRSVTRIPYDGLVYHLETKSGMFCCPVQSYNSSAKELAPLVKSGILTEKNSEEWLEKAKQKPVHQLAEEARAAKANGGAGKVEVEKVFRVTYGLYEAQYDNLMRALDIAKGLAQSDKSGHLIDLICTEFLAQYGAKHPNRKRAIQRYAKMLERAYGVKLIIVDDSDSIVHGKKLAAQLEA